MRIKANSLVWQLFFGVLNSAYMRGYTTLVLSKSEKKAVVTAANSLAEMGFLMDNANLCFRFKNSFW